MVAMICVDADVVYRLFVAELEEFEEKKCYISLNTKEDNRAGSRVNGNLKAVYLF